MPAAIEAPPPAAAPTPAAPPSAPAGTAPPSGGQINVSQLPTGDPSLTAPRPGSARWRMQQDLRKKAGMEPEPEPGQPAPPPAAKTPPAPTPDPKTATPAKEGEPAEGEPAQPEPAEATDPKTGKKMSPWKLVDLYKQRALKAETEALEYKKNVVPEEERKKSTETLAQYETRMKEMQEDLRYFNAEKYDPDIIKANGDYQNAWKRAMSDLSEIPFNDPNTQQTRPISAEDILALVNMTLPQAREAAEQYFGAFAQDVMNHRSEIRKLFNEKMAKLEELKKTGADRDQKRQQAYTQAMENIQKEVKTTYEEENQRALSNEKTSKFFSEREGDEDWNKRLKQGYAMVDQAYSENAMNPQLTKEQRAEVVRRHAAVRNRAASWGALRFENERLNTKLAEVEKELATYKSSTPSTGGAPASNAPATLGSARDRMFADLQKLAK